MRCSRRAEPPPQISTREAKNREEAETKRRQAGGGGAHAQAREVKQRQWRCLLYESLLQPLQLSFWCASMEVGVTQSVDIFKILLGDQISGHLHSDATATRHRCPQQQTLRDLDDTTQLPASRNPNNSNRVTCHDGSCGKPVCAN
jgi:hypothetical protein